MTKNNGTEVVFFKNGTVILPNSTISFKESIIVNQKIYVVYICKVSVFQLGIFCSHTHRKAIAHKT